MYVRDWNIMLKLSVALLVPKILLSTALGDFLFFDSELYQCFFGFLGAKPIYWFMILVAGVANVLPFFFMSKWQQLVSDPNYTN